MKKFTIVIEIKGLTKRSFEMQAENLDKAKRIIQNGFTLPHNTYQTEWSFYSETENKKRKESLYGFSLSFQLRIDGQEKTFIPAIYRIRFIEHKN